MMHGMRRTCKACFKVKVARDAAGLTSIDLLIPIDALFSAKRAVEPLGFTLSAAPMEFHEGKIRIYRLVKIDPETGEELVLDFLLVTPDTAKAWETRREVERIRMTLSEDSRPTLRCSGLFGRPGDRGEARRILVFLTTLRKQYRRCWASWIW